MAGKTVNFGLNLSLDNNFDYLDHRYKQLFNENWEIIDNKIFTPPAKNVILDDTSNNFATKNVEAALAQTITELRSHKGSGGTAHAIATGTVDGFMSASDKAKLDGIAAGGINQTSADARYVQLSGSVMTGPLTLPGDPTQNLHASTKQYVDAVRTGADAKFLQLAGGTMNGHITLPVADPTIDRHAASKKYVDNVKTYADTIKAYADSIKQALDIKDSVKAATTVNINLGANATKLIIDGIQTQETDRILVKNQTAGAENGIYVVQADGSFIRSVDADTAIKVTSGMFVFVEQGTAHGDSGWVLTTDGAITIGTTALSFTQFSGAGQITAGIGLVKNGSTLSLDTTGVAANTYRSVQVDTTGRILAGTNPTTIDGYSITDAVKTSGSVMTGLLTLSGDPTADLHASTKKYVDLTKQNLDTKDSVKVATTANITLSAAQTIDNVALIAGDRVLVKDQTTSAENGIYIVQTGAWTRAVDADASTKVNTGMYTFVEQGTTNINTGWILSTTGAITIGTTAQTFVQFTGAGLIAAGTGLSKSGNTLSIANTGVTAGIYKSVTVDVQGRITAGTNPTTLSGYGISDAVISTDVVTVATANKILKLDVNSKLPASITGNADGNAATATKFTTARNITLTGDATATATLFDGSADISIATTLSNSGVTVGTYKSVTVDVKGRVTAGTNPTSLSGYGITDAVGVTVNASEVVAGITATTITSFTPVANGNFIVYVFYRVATSANILIEVKATDASGTLRTYTVANVTGAAIGAYTTTPMFINATTASAITITATAGTATSIYVSSTITKI